MLSWNHDTLLFVALTLCAAAWMVLQLVLAVRAARAKSLPRWLRFSAWLPPLTPLAGYLSGARALVLIWCLVTAVYLVLRTQV